MIFGNLKYADKYDFLAEKIKACFTYVVESCSFKIGRAHV